VKFQGRASVFSLVDCLTVVQYCRITLFLNYYFYALGSKDPDG